MILDEIDSIFFACHYDWRLLQCDNSFQCLRVDHLLDWLCVIKIQEKCLNLNEIRTLRCNVSNFINIFCLLGIVNLSWFVGARGIQFLWLLLELHNNSLSRCVWDLGAALCQCILLVTSCGVELSSLLTYQYFTKILSELHFTRIILLSAFW